MLEWIKANKWIAIAAIVVLGFLFSDAAPDFSSFGQGK